jgi:hypothetical protein
MKLITIVMCTEIDQPWATDDMPSEATMDATRNELKALLKKTPGKMLVSQIEYIL